MKTTTKERGIVVREGMGGFLCPPTHPEHTQSVQTDLRRRRENRSSMSLSHALTCDWLEDRVKHRVQQILEQWNSTKPALDTPAVQEWILTVLGYFKGCYKGDNGSWNVADLRMVPNANPMENIDDHAGVRLIRKYYPDFTPTAAQFDEAYWGTKPRKEQ